MKARDRPRIGVLRSALGAIDNAEAVEGTTDRPTDETATAGATSGVGSSEVARHQLSEREMAELVRAEARDLRSSAEEYAGHGQPERAKLLASQADVLQAHLDHGTDEPPA